MRMSQVTGYLLKRMHKRRQIWRTRQKDKHQQDGAHLKSQLLGRLKQENHKFWQLRPYLKKIKTKGLGM